MEIRTHIRAGNLRTEKGLKTLREDIALGFLTWLSADPRVSALILPKFSNDVRTFTKRLADRYTLSLDEVIPDYPDEFPMHYMLRMARIDRTYKKLTLTAEVIGYLLTNTAGITLANDLSFTFYQMGLIGICGGIEGLVIGKNIASDLLAKLRETTEKKLHSAQEKLHAQIANYLTRYLPEERRENNVIIGVNTDAIPQNPEYN